MHRNRNTKGAPMPTPQPNLLIGMMIGSVILAMAGGAMTLGASLAMTQGGIKRK
ncbi:MAG TPA: hypothetical protein VN702_16085 [Acetobacteraceae bacterium]|nr:hypothetical protein [Acetobacteraceae bacterium]